MKRSIVLLCIVSGMLLGVEREHTPKKRRTEVGALVRDQLYYAVDVGVAQYARTVFEDNQQEISAMSINDRCDLYEYAKRRHAAMKMKLSKSASASIRLNDIKYIRNFLYALSVMEPFNFIQSYFSNPRGLSSGAAPDEVIKMLIRTERSGIVGCMFHLTLFDMANAMIKQRGHSNEALSLDLITDHRFQDYNCHALNILVANGACVSVPRLDDHVHRFEQMYHKFFVFNNTLHGKRVLVTGSCNATGYAANNSYDNIILIQDEATIDRYLAEFSVIKNICRPLALEECQKNQSSSYTSIKNDRIPQGSYDEGGVFASQSKKSDRRLND